MKKHLFAIVYALCLTAFTVYVALDAFVIARVYAVGSAGELPQEVTVLPTSSPATITDNTYEDANVRIILTEYREHDTTIHAADVTLTSPALLKTALAKDAYGRNVTETTSAMAERSGAILAINGDYYGSRERGFVLRNGQLLRNTASSGTEALAIMSDGSFRIEEESTTSAQALLEAGAVQVFSFGPALVEAGAISVTAEDEVGKAMANNPRTAIGIFRPGHYLLVVSDGRTRDSEGLSLLELAGFMQAMGVTTAYNLDGGGSSTMVFNGRVVNNPTTNGRKITERSVSDIVYIGY